jgi:hypothetical protein
MIPASIMEKVLPGLIIAAVLAFGAYKIDQHGYKRATAECSVTITKMKDDQEQADQAAAQKAKVNMDAQNKNLLRLSESLITANQQIEAQAGQLKERVHDVSTQFRLQPTAALQPVPDWVVTRGWVCDYNRAIGYGNGVPGDGTAAGGAEDTSCASDAFSPSGISAQRILWHHEQYGTYCRKLEEQLNAILDHEDFVEKQAEQAGK